MTPHEKAMELFRQMYFYQFKSKGAERRAKQCAAIAVQEIMNGNFADGYDHQFWSDVLDELQTS